MLTNVGRDAMQALALEHRSKLLPLVMLGEIVTVFIISQDKMQGVPLAISAIAFLIHEPLRYNRSQGKVSQNRIFVERTIIVLVPYLTYIAYVLLRPRSTHATSLRTWKERILFPYLGVAAIFLRSTVTKEREIQKRYLNYIQCPIVIYIGRSPEELAKELKQFMDMNFPVHVEVITCIEQMSGTNQAKDKKKQLLKYLSDYLSQDLEKMNFAQFGCKLMVDLCEIGEKGSEEREASYSNIMPSICMWIQTGKCDLPLPCGLMVQLMQQHSDLAKKYIERNPGHVEMMSLSSNLLSDLNIDIEACKKNRVGALKDMTYNKFQDFDPGVKKMVAKKVLDASASKEERVNRKELWHKFSRSLCSQLLLYAFKDDDFSITKELTEEEVYKGASDILDLIRLVPADFLEMLHMRIMSEEMVEKLLHYHPQPCKYSIFNSLNLWKEYNCKTNLIAYAQLHKVCQEMNERVSACWENRTCPETAKDDTACSDLEDTSDSEGENDSYSAIEKH